MNATATHRKVLVLSSDGQPSADVIDRLGAGVDVETVGTIEAARLRLKESGFDLVIAEPTFIKKMAARHATNRNVKLLLETIGQGVCILDVEGTLQWDNPRMRSYPDDLVKRIGEACRRAFRDSEKDRKSVV